MKAWLAKKFYVVAIYWWCIWSRVYRFIWHHKYKSMAVGPYLTTEEASKKMELLTWTKDGVKELWDSVGSPGWVQYAISEIESGNTQPKGSLDCDDFSVWAANSIQERYNPVIWIFSWESDSKLMGHAMCLCQSESGSYFHIGNWGPSEEFSCLREACEDVLTKYDSSTPIGWALLSKNIWPIRWGTGLPSKEVKNG